ncbi:MAG: hypothetical protein SNJ64_02060 [Endomicrobiia bacterium]
MKKIFYYVIFITIIFFNFLHSSSKFIITGVAPDQKTYQDWIEIFLLDNASFEEIRNLRLEVTDYQNVKEVVLSTVVPLENRILEKHKFICVYVKKETTQYLIDERDNLVIHLTTNTFRVGLYGLYASDGIVAIKNSATNYLDVLAFCDSNGSTDSTIVNKFSSITAQNQWSPSGSFTQETCVASDKVGNNKPMVRIKGSNGLPVDTNTKNDWKIVLKDTPGWGYKEIVPADSQKVVEVDKNYNPFCPEDENNNSAVILFNIPDIDAKKTVKIFDIKGKEVITLLDNDEPYNQTGVYVGINVGNVLWDGRDKYGNRVPTGVYVVYFEAYNPLTGQRFTGKDVVVVGRRF